MNRLTLKTVLVGALALAAVMIVAVLYSSEKASAGRSPVASPFSKVGQKPIYPPAGVNAITGEPLPESAKQYIRESERLHDR